MEALPELRAIVPPEPAHMSIVLTTAGHAFQRRSTGFQSKWIGCEGIFGAIQVERTWTQMVIAGPLRIVFDAAALPDTGVPGVPA